MRNSDRSLDNLCPVCNSNSKKVQTMSDQFHIRQCSECKLGYLFPQPSSAEVIDLYTNGSYYSEDGAGYVDYQGQETTLRMTFKRLLQKMKSSGASTGTLLEIGCGFGFFLDEAKPYFKELMGTEMDPTAAFTATQLGITVQQTSLESFRMDTSWDVVCMIQVIEHLQAPSESIERMKKLLKPSGHLLIVTPDFNSPLRYLLRKKWPSYKIPEHLYYFNRQSLGKLLNSHGATQQSWISYPHAFPLGLIGESLHLPIPRRWLSCPVWIPWTSIAVLAKFD